MITVYSFCWLLNVDVDVDIGHRCEKVTCGGSYSWSRTIPEFQYFLKIIIFFHKKIRFWETTMGNFNTVEPRSTDTHLIRKPAVYNGQFRLSRHWKISYDFLWKVTRLLETPGYADTVACPLQSLPLCPYQLPSCRTGSLQ